MELLTLPEPPASAELVIIGAGIVGAATAYHASKRGQSSVILERRGEPASLTTPRATGGFRLQFDNLAEITLIAESIELFHELEQEGFDLGIKRQGYLWCTTEQEGMERQVRMVEMQRSWGLDDVELLSGDEVRERFPYISDEVLQARFRQSDGFIDPRALTMALLSQSGAEVVLECEVERLLVENDRITGVSTSRGDVSCAQVILAAGPFTGPIAETVGLELPLSTVRRQKLINSNAPMVPMDAPMVIDEETGAHWRPALGGAYLLHTDSAEPSSPPADPVEVDESLRKRLLDPESPASVCRITPFWAEMKDDTDSEWKVVAGQYTMTPDHMPLVGASRIEGLWLNCGYSGHGIMGSGACSRMLIDIMAGRISDDENPLHPDREFVQREISAL